jgi:GDPmannose 4,6-dehydratase
MAKSALVTGILGQDGPYLAKLLLEKGYRVYGLVRRYSNPNLANLDFLDLTSKIEFVNGDLSDEASLINVVKTVRPDEIYNLAAQSFVGASWEQAKLTTEINSLGVLYLLNAIKLFVPIAKFYQASTSEMFGLGQTNGYQDENTSFHPRSPYGVSKVYAYWMTVNFRESYGIYACNGILFNHESPIRGINFVTRKISDGVARIKLGLANDIHLGNLEAKRDWGFAGDYVQAMHLMLQQDKPDDYVVGTGENHSVAEFVELAFNEIGIKDWKKYVVVDPNCQRPAEVPNLRANPQKTKKVLGWKPTVSFPDLVTMMVKADLERLQRNKR